jgi:RNA polymerase sigma-70 factor (ECF subfamily)
MASWKVAADDAMARYATGEDAAFGQLYDALSPRLFAFLTRRLCNVEIARDLLQQTFLQIHRTRGKFVPGRPVAAYAFAIATRLCIDIRRRARPEQSLPNDDALGAARIWISENPVDRTFDAKRALRMVKEEFQRWSPEQRQLFELVTFDGLSHGEVAAILGMTTNAVKLRMSRLRALLEALRGEHGRLLQNRRRTANSPK